MPVCISATHAAIVCQPFHHWSRQGPTSTSSAHNPRAPLSMHPTDDTHGTQQHTHRAPNDCADSSSPPQRVPKRPQTQGAPGPSRAVKKPTTGSNFVSSQGNHTQSDGVLAPKRRRLRDKAPSITPEASYPAIFARSERLAKRFPHLSLSSF